jgi:hypothetical protein
MRDVHVRMPVREEYSIKSFDNENDFKAILSNQQEIDEWLDFGRYKTDEVKSTFFRLKKTD